MTLKRNKVVSTVVAAALAMTLLAPFAEAAEMDTSASAGAKVSVPAARGAIRPNIGSSGQDGVSGKMAPTAAQFCVLIDSRMNLTVEKMGAMKAKLDSERSSRDSRVDGRRGNRDNVLKGARDIQDARLDGIVAMLNARATTEVQKAAIVSFQASMKTALSVRRADVDKANADFRTGTEKLRAEHMTKVDAAVTALETAIQAALDQAKSDCTAGNTGVTVRATMLKSIEAARAKFKADTADIDKIGPAAKKLAEAHRAALDKAFATFKASAEAARKALKAAFPEKPAVKVDTKANVNVSVPAAQ